MSALSQHGQLVFTTSIGPGNSIYLYSHITEDNKLHKPDSDNKNFLLIFAQSVSYLMIVHVLGLLQHP